MIYSQATGGLGNQLYNYAIGFALAQKYQDNLTLDISPYKFSARPFVLDKLTISGKVVPLFPPIANNKPCRLIARLLRKAATNRYGACRWVKELPSSRNRFENYDFSHKSSLYLEGFWQNYRYFDAYYDLLCKEFQPKEETLSAKCHDLIHTCQNINSVALHIRRGDYEASWILDDAYYTTALKIIREKISNPVFYVFCEDTDYVRKKYGHLPNVTFVTENYKLSDLEEFFVLSACRHQVIANSTYSWWAAYLNTNPDKIVIAPEYMQWSKEYYPTEWTIITPIGSK